MTKAATGRCEELTCWGDIPVLLREPNLLLYFFAGFLSIGRLNFGVFQEKIDFRLGLTFLIPLAFLVIFLAAEKLDLLSSLSQTVWPERVTWAVCLMLGAISGGFFGGLFQSLRRLPQIVIRVVLSGIICFLLLGWPEGLVLDLGSVFSGVGAWPGAVTHSYAVDKYKTTEIESVLPSWPKKDEINWRFDCMNYMLSFWWSLAVDVPNSRGYSQFFRSNQSFWYSWLTAGMTNWWGEEIERPIEISQNTGRFLIDWYALRYLEDSNRTLLIDNPYSDFILQEPMSDRHAQVGVLSFYRLSEDKTSPIVKASNAQVMLVVGLKETFVYDNLVKVLAAENLNSQVLVPVRGPDTLDELKRYDLNDFDLIVLNDYRYKDFRSWQFLAEYVKAGGRLIIETGTQVRESDSATLPDGESQFPEVFPITASKRESLGTAWQLTKADHPVLAGIDFGEFGPLVYEETSWKLSFVPDKASLKRGAKVLLAQKGYPVLVDWKLGQGEVIWSGLNLPYHFLTYDRPEEAEFFRNIASFLLQGLPSGETDFVFERKRPEKVKITGKDFTGVVFKEFFHPGWRARVNGKKAKVYPAGPDFMYIRVPKDLQRELEVELSFRGSTLDWFFFCLSLGTMGLIVWYLVTGRGLDLISAKKKIDHWWAREEE